MIWHLTINFTAMLPYVAGFVAGYLCGIATFIWMAKSFEVFR